MVVVNLPEMQRSIDTKLPIFLHLLHHVPHTDSEAILAGIYLEPISACQS